MKEVKGKVFNLNVYRPKVLLLGNGIIYRDELTWKKVLATLSTDEKKTNMAEILFEEIPSPILATICINTEDASRHNDYLDLFARERPDEFPILDEILSLPFDAILTTNYTYEIEKSINPEFSTTKGKIGKYAKFLGDKESKFLIHRFNRVKDENGVEKDIWHIHGEARRKSSMVLTHDEYARLIGKILEFNANRKNDYEKNFQEFEFKSWIDYFLMGDLYVVGQSFDPCEFDLWWLLNRQMRERGTTGKTIFYEPVKSESNGKIKALEAMNVKCVNCGVDVAKNPQNYDIFYKKAVDAIRTELQDVR